MADMMPKKNYDLTEITRLLLEMRKNCIPKAGEAYEDPTRTEKYDALNAAIDLINNPSRAAGKWIRANEEQVYFDVEYTCSECGFTVAVSGIGTPLLYGYKHCPNCGLKMDGGKENV